MTTRIRLTFRTFLLLLVLSLTVGTGPAIAAGAVRDHGPSRTDGTAGSARLGEVPMLAHADTYGPGIWHHAKEGKTWYGAYRTFEDAYAYCIDAGKQSPLPEYFKGSRPEKVTSPQTAWALHQHAESKSADVHAALSTIARRDAAIPHDHKVPPREPSELGREFEEGAKQYAAITADAERFAGPYRLKLGLRTIPGMPVLEPHAKPIEEPGSAVSPEGEDRREKNTTDTDMPEKGPLEKGPPEKGPLEKGPPEKGPLEKGPAEKKLTLPAGDQVEVSVSLISATGHLVPDVRVHLTVDGVDVAPATLTTGRKPVLETYTVDGPGKVTAAATAQVASDSILLFKPAKSRVQRVITADKPAEVSARAVVDLKSQPSVTTEISDQTPTPGESVTDEFTVTGLIGDHRVTVVHELWRTGSKPEIGEKNADAEVIGTVTSTSVGNGTHRSAAVPVPDDFTGWLYFTETVAPDEKTKEWKGTHGQPRETGFVPWTPTAETTAVLDGTKAHDEVDISGMRPGAELALTVTAHHSDTLPKQSAKVRGEEIDSQDFRVTADHNGKASLRTADITVPVGWVTFVVTIDGDDAHRSWASDWGIPAETVHRSAPKAPPPAPAEETPAPPSAPSPAPATQPPPPEEPSPPAEETPAPDEQSPADAAPAKEPPVEPVADQPQAPRAPDQLPRTGTRGNGVLVGAGLLLIGLGVSALLISGRRSPED